jgi:hypothetical protein
MTVWIYVDTSKQAGDSEHLKVFVDEAAANAWFAEHDPEGVDLNTRSRDSIRRCVAGILQGA